jgi:hypothetical protein
MNKATVWAQLEPLQNEATKGDGKKLTVPEPARPVRFVIRSQGPATSGEITIEQQQALWGKPEWRELQTIPVPNDLSEATYDAREVSGVFRARISAPVTGGTVSVWPFVTLG